jgi:peptide/nickel transport system substrate-binding protein
MTQDARDDVFDRIFRTERPLTRRSLLQLAGVGASASFIAACGSSSTSDDQAENTGEETAVKRGGVAKMAISDATATENLDPALSFTTNDAVYCGLIYEALTITDTEWNVQPSLAESWEPNEDATEWTFNLRQGVQWHDGTPFTAKDVEYTIKRWLDEELGSSMFGRIEPSIDAKGITLVDDHTVKFALKRPDSLLPVALALRNAKITKDGTDKFEVATAIGTGPFKLKSWTPNRSWSVEKNPSYWQTDLPYLDGVEAVIVPDQGTKVQNVTSGPSHIGDSVDISSWTTVEGNANVTLAKIENRQTWTFILDQSSKPFNDPRVVEAVKLSVDRQKVLDSVLQGNGSTTADVPIPTDSPFFPSGLEQELDYDKAKQLLAEAGYPDGFDMELSTSAVTAGMVEMAQAFQQVVKPAGINVKLKQFPTSAYWNKGWMQTMAFQDYWNHRHPGDMLALFYQTDAAWNEAKHDKSEIDPMIAEVFKATEPEDQKAKIQAAYEFAVENIGYAIPVFAPSAFIHKNVLKGMEMNYTDYISLTKASLEA